MAVQCLSGAGQLLDLQAWGIALLCVCGGTQARSGRRRAGRPVCCPAQPIIPGSRHPPILPLQVMCGNVGIPTATVTMKGPDGIARRAAAIGTGPVDAAYKVGWGGMGWVGCMLGSARSCPAEPAHIT